VLVIVGGSQELLREQADTQCSQLGWRQEFGLVHLTGDSDRDATTLQHPHYLALPFYHNMAGLFRARAYFGPSAGLEPEP
jgi:UDP-N-acetylglucosamine--N-acetylmuramyl-(pentapeptide) pyrophosphoryl-undecaprenol N-acetylglucosamine transferase